MILFRLIQCFSSWNEQSEVWENDDVTRGLYVTAEGALRVMKQLKADNPGYYKVEVIETDDEKEVEN